ncbi:MAG: hypothetical protein RLZZ15_1031, partial [Verrucomicrobiota bacterium]
MATAVGFTSTLRDYFLGDDFAYVGRYWDFPFAAWPRLFVGDWAGGLWSARLNELRPFNALLFMIDGRLWGVNPLGFHLTNLLLHAGCATLVGVLALRVTGRSLGGALLATVLFAVHPVHATAVTWICGRVDLLATGLALAALLAFLRDRDERPGETRFLWLLAVAFAGLLWTKEVGFTFPALLIAADTILLGRLARWREWRTWRPYVVVAAVFAVYLACRGIAFGVAGPSGVGAGLPDVTRGAFFAEFFQREFSYAAYLAPPTQPWLRAWRDAGFALEGRSLARLGLLATGVIVLAGAVALSCRGARAQVDRRALGFFGAAWFLIATTPLMVTYFSPRHLYPATVGVAVVVALLIRGLLRTRVAFALGACALAALFAGQLFRALAP